MTQTFTARYFAGLARGQDEIRTAVLTDEDLIRDNNAVETVTDSVNPGEIFDGFFTIRGAEPPVPVQVRTDFTGEVSATVVFNDGTSLNNVLGLRDQEVTVVPVLENFVPVLLDQAALAAVGKTIDDVVDIFGFQNVDHDLTWAQLGFSADGAADPDTGAPAPTPEPEPVINVVDGRDFNERLRGTNDDDLIIGRGGNDRLVGRDGDDVLNGGSGNDVLVGGAGADTFVFGAAESRNGNRERDVIRDFDASEDTIVFDDDIVIRNAVERNGNVIIRLEGDRDAIVIRDADLSILDSIVYSDESFLA